MPKATTNTNVLPRPIHFWSYGDGYCIGVDHPRRKNLGLRYLDAGYYNDDETEEEAEATPKEHDRKIAEETITCINFCDTPNVTELLAERTLSGLLEDLMPLLSHYEEMCGSEVAHLSALNDLELAAVWEGHQDLAESRLSELKLILKGSD